jgi:hypothetical protein
MVLLLSRAYLVQFCQERVDRVSTLLRLLAHPPMTRPFQNGDLRLGALGRTSRERLPAAVMIFCRDQRQTRLGGCPWQPGSEIAHHWLSGRSVHRQYCPAQVLVRTCSYFLSNRCGHAQALEPLCSGLGRHPCHLRNRLLADVRRLPSLRHVVPDVIRVEAPQNIAHPRSYQTWTLHCDPYDVPPRPSRAPRDRSVVSTSRVRWQAIRDRRRWNSQSREGLRSQIRAETDEQRHRCANAGLDRPRSPPFQDFREQEQSSSKLLPNNICRTCRGRGAPNSRLLKVSLRP